MRTWLYIDEGSSPLSRGIRRKDPTSEHQPRIIPALAGNTSGNPAGTNSSRDHPRSRGEYHCRFDTNSLALGSSPLSRGIPRRGVVCRLRGGSSPLSRGILRWRRDASHYLGIIPALAGNTLGASMGSPISRDHPRSRGEYRSAASNRPWVDGSSPLSRGIPAPRLSGRGWRRIIPALAGNTRRQMLTTWQRWDHPRSRGEYLLRRPGRRGGRGSSPLSRGIPAACWLATPPGRIIPALAGNTGRRDTVSGPVQDHPRSRGEYNVTRKRWFRQVGSSPLSRGIHLLTRDFISRTCRILGTPSSHVSASRSHSPRVCDGRPPGGVGRLVRHLKDLDGPSGSAPRSRLVPMDHPMSGRTYLARSWRGTP